MPWNNINIDAMQIERYQDIYRRINVHRSIIHKLLLTVPLSFDVQNKIQYNRMLEETLWHHMSIERENEAKRAVMRESIWARNSIFDGSVDTSLRVQPTAGFPGFWKEPWDAKIASKDYTDFEHRGVGFKQLSNFEDGFIRSAVGKKLVGVRIINVDIKTTMATIIQLNTKLEKQFDFNTPIEIEASQVLYRCTLDPRSVLLCTEVLSELQKREEYMSYDDIVQAIKKPTKYFQRESYWKFDGTGLPEGQLVYSFLSTFAKDEKNHKFCREMFNVTGKKSIKSLEDAAKQIPNVSVKRITCLYTNDKLAYLDVRVHAANYEKDYDYPVRWDRVNWRYLLFHITDTTWNKPGPEDDAKQAKNLVDMAPFKARNKPIFEQEQARAAYEELHPVKRKPRHTKLG